MPSTLDTFNGGFDSFTRNEVLAVGPPPPMAPINPRSIPMWTHDPGYRAISRAPVNRYSVYHAMPWVWWEGRSVAVHGSGFGPSGGGAAGAPSGFAGRAGAGEGGGRGGE